jgi:hypothetical protein
VNELLDQILAAGGVSAAAATAIVFASAAIAAAAIVVATATAATGAALVARSFGCRQLMHGLGRRGCSGLGGFQGRCRGRFLGRVRFVENGGKAERPEILCRRLS